MGWGRREGHGKGEKNGTAGSVLAVLAGKLLRTVGVRFGVLTCGGCLLEMSI